MKFQVTDERIIKARDLIITTNKKIYDIAEECGFKSLSYFNSAFGYRFGKTPTQIRRELEKSTHSNLQSVKIETEIYKGEKGK